MTDLVDELVPPKKVSKTFRKILWIITVLLILGGGAFTYWKYFRKEAAVPVNVEKIEKKCNKVEKQPGNTKQPASGEKKPDAAKTTQGDNKNASPAA